MLELTVADERTDETRLSLRQRQMHIHLSLSKIQPPPTKKTKPGNISHFFSEVSCQCAMTGC